MSTWNPLEGPRLLMILATTVVSGVLTLLTSPMPGDKFQGDGHAVVEVGADHVSIVGCEFEGVSIRSPYTARGTKIVGNTISGVRENPRGCYYGGGQAIQVANAANAPEKLVIGNTIKDFDCIGISTYNIGPVHNIVISGNEDDGSGLWAILGPDSEFSDLSIIGNHFRSPARVGHGFFVPYASGLVVAGNIFEEYVMYEFRVRSQAVECGNEYRSSVDLRGGRFLPRARMGACPVRGAME